MRGPPPVFDVMLRISVGRCAASVGRCTACAEVAYPARNSANTDVNSQTGSYEKESCGSCDCFTLRMGTNVNEIVKIIKFQLNNSGVFYTSRGF